MLHGKHSVNSLSVIFFFNFKIFNYKTCKYATLLGKNEFVGVIKIEMVRWRDFLACLMNL